MFDLKIVRDIKKILKNLLLKFEFKKDKMSLTHLGPDSEFPPLGKGKLRLYSMVFCPYALRSRLVLAAKNIP